ncbi:peptidylprolyl isomerase [Cytobacillus firmus]|uniref:peptidylprolyl isomerase n=1 Tax=Cytobacillus firmus TaxID=1399 RepID=UPI00077C7EB0|nr:peptidylprolyl isomerase [Cytobacillus firmus]MBG9541603.1 peptidylprolyl isomerase [Cytobacillus firmus]MBG9555027.1 peptidylprolyl isomerase [Cytobacillus firmus]MBG9558399.1 peptidylprolyl isomerase [Cytobacillus firmus]MBG9573698.1 peptidylprolyl isomerase [Cytobacillus firmus]MEC1893251.1 peptidylprolyl isomerase [Cytobacillus firmus]
MKWRMLTPILILMFILSACGTSTEKEADNANGSETEEKQTNNQASETPDNFPQLTEEVQGNERLVEMQTSKGNIKIKLFPDQAPKAVENFIKHSEDGYYDGLIFHRVIQDFMIQGGDPEGTGMGGESIYGEAFEDEFSNELFHIRGALSMANAGPNTNGSQFFIVQNTTLDPSLKEQMEKAGYPEEIIKAYGNGGTPTLDHKHTVFGQVVEGMDVVDSIAAVETAEQDKPAEDVVIEKIEVLK